MPAGREKTVTMKKINPVSPYLAETGYAVGRPYKLPGKHVDLVEALAPADHDEAHAILAALMFYEESQRHETDDPRITKTLAEIKAVLDRAGVAR
jgi:hypothetical protein